MSENSHTKFSRAATLTEEEKILAGEVFVCINEEYQLFKSQRQL